MRGGSGGVREREYGRRDSSVRTGPNSCARESKRTDLIDLIL